MDNVSELRPRSSEPEAKSVVQVIETGAGDLRVLASEGITKTSIVGNLMIAAARMASAD